MPAIIDSAPDCVKAIGEAGHGTDDSADFILQAAYDKCAGIMTWGPGSTYGEDGAAATDAYYILTYVGIIVTVLVIVLWVIYENKRLREHVARIRSGGGMRAKGPSAVPPGTTPEAP